MTLSTDLRTITASIRAQLVVLPNGPATALRVQARNLDALAARVAAIEHDNALMMDRVPLHPACLSDGIVYADAPMRVPGGDFGRVIDNGC